jgi:acetoin utilization deacetylase AcuC-like enzyme
MTAINKIGLIIDEDFSLKNIPPYPHPTFLSYETPLRIRSSLDLLKFENIFANEKVLKVEPLSIDEEVLNLAHTTYHIEMVKNFSNRGYGILGDEVFITEDTYELAKKAVGGAIQALKSVLDSKINQSFALIRPPGHHALQEISSGLCIFNNIANAVSYLRKEMRYNKNIAIIDIDAHFGDGLVQYFYDDPSVLYFSVHEFDFVEGDIGFIDEVGEGEGFGRNINFPMPMGISDDEFLVFMDILEPILYEFKPDLIVIAAGFDMHYSDPIGNTLLTSISYYRFAKRILKITEEISQGKLSFILEGGYSLIGLPQCVLAVIKALLKEDYEPPNFERLKLSTETKVEDLNKIKASLKKILAQYWKCFS